MQTMYVVGSVSHAMLGRRILQTHGVQAFVRRTSGRGQSGCGYALFVPRDVPQVAVWLHAGGVKVLEVQRGDHP